MLTISYFVALFLFNSNVVVFAFCVVDVVLAAAVAVAVAGVVIMAAIEYRSFNCIRCKHSKFTFYFVNFPLPDRIADHYSRLHFFSLSIYVQCRQMQYIARICHNHHLIPSRCNFIRLACFCTPSFLVDFAFLSLLYRV